MMNELARSESAGGRARARDGAARRYQSGRGSCYRGVVKSRVDGLVFELLVSMAARWLQRSDLLIVEYLREENRVLLR